MELVLPWRPYRSSHGQREQRPLKHPWPLLNNELCVYLLKTVLLSSLESFMALLTAFPLLRRYVSVVSDDQECSVEGALSIWGLRCSSPDYDQKPLVVFLLKLTGHHKRLDTFQLIRRHSFYFIPSSFVSIEVPNTQCFQLEAITYFVQKTGATLLPTAVHYHRSIYKNCQCLTELGPPTPVTMPLFQERSLFTFGPGGLRYGFHQFIRGDGSMVRPITLRDHYNSEVETLDILDVVDLEKLPGVDTDYVRELRVRVVTSCCTETECYFPKMINISDCGKDVLTRLCVTFKGQRFMDAPFIYRYWEHMPDLWPVTDTISFNDPWPKSSFTLVNLDWSLLSFNGGGMSCCPAPERHRMEEDPRWKRKSEGPMYFTVMYQDFSYVGVPIETVLRTDFTNANSLSWKRLTRVDPYESPDDNPQRIRHAGSQQVIQDFQSERFMKLIHPKHNTFDGGLEIQAIWLRSLKIWSHLNELEPLPLFALSRLETLVLVALSNSQISWNINQLIKKHDQRRARPLIERAVLGAVGIINPSHKLVLEWNEYSILAPSVIDLTLIGYALDKFCGTTNPGSFDKLQSLSIDVTNLPFNKNSRGQQRLHIRVCPLEFPKIKHLDLLSAYDGTLGFPVVGECHTEVWVPKTCVSVRASTALAAYPLLINGKLVGNGGDQAVRDGRWRVWWMRIGEEFVYKETLRLPIDPDIVEMNR